MCAVCKSVTYFHSEMSLVALFLDVPPTSMWSLSPGCPDGPGGSAEVRMWAIKHDIRLCVLRCCDRALVVSGGGSNGRTGMQPCIGSESLPRSAPVHVQAVSVPHLPAEA